MAEHGTLRARVYDSKSRLQMAEGRLDAQRGERTDIADMFLVSHYEQPELSDQYRIDLVLPDGRTVAVGIDELRALPTREIVAVLECAGNGRGLRDSRAPGNQFGLGMFGQAKWVGTSLRTVLAEFDGTEGWEYAVLHAPDNGVTQPEDKHAYFAKGLHRDKALHPDTMLCWQVNDGPLPVEHGGPVRLVVPGWYGIWWVKWPTRIDLTSTEFHGFWQHERYTYQDDNGEVLAVVGQQRPRAVVLSPEEGEAVGDDAVISGVAWAGPRQVARVEITADDGTNWIPAELAAPEGAWSWVRWNARLPAGLPRGMRRIAARVVDDAGETQDWTAPLDRLGYGNNQIHIVNVDLIARPRG
ncbi:molybdenum-dependent oxidoreductase-like protein [Tamaricihabitans halophyticus]|uniref:Molybdenum-dependent oxidoreductase-like protein n=1 Tax=Tamaricihabitans halophyticus TaxID=1262583 RepID=A0A4R2QFJ1_9PSEU|nr:molybdopterin-dependent oxidoreductase [Tamaricihabitans halophyticus]TCP47827.1 molybdenum-dependent oxidoreductase-like protein [Tamaricihabitans halophyticus]